MGIDSHLDGHHTPWHQTHLGGIIQRGPGLAMVEATSVTPEGRITPEDSGLWKDSQMAPLKYSVDFAHSQGQKIGIQLAHAGRKASTVAPWLARSAVAPKDVNGWPDNVLAPSDVAYPGLADPKAMSKDDIESLKRSWVAAVQRAVKIGFDVIEIHNAHGYLLHSFLSPASNKRTDEYGGSFENRIRLTLEIVELTRQNVPEDMPIFLRISATDWLENEEGMDSWKTEDTVRLAEILVTKGIDLLDVSTGGLHPNQKIKGGPGYQAPFAQKVKEKVGDSMKVGTVGTITNGKQANELLERGLDLAIVGRYFQKNPGLVWTFAEDLGVEINVANQIRWGFGGRTGIEKEAQALSDFGGAFCMGGIGGAVWHGVKGFRNSPYGERRIGAITAIKARAPVLGGNFGVWGGLFSTFDCAVKGLRKKEDPYNAIIAGFFTGGSLAIRGGMRAARNSAIGCAILLAVIEGVGIGIQRMMAENTRLDVAPPPPPPASEGTQSPMIA
ncbi:MAG: hypothetical protein L6R39_006323 [Caloplaca ligustica]|nr:MAG: hypothetical protein L6R39_006323 [Caloplaca ligustica]